MSGVWIFDKKGVATLITNPTKESFEQKESSSPSPLISSGTSTSTSTAPGARPRVLVYLPTNQLITSYFDLELRLTQLGWTRYYNHFDCPNDLIQFHKSDCSSHLISLPSDFSNFKPFHMYDIVVKNPSFFQVRHLR
ncbi:flowering promoting factor 1 [Euphorbia peplus]|nr:flowering promoting factor 1 [Euphorbia peplus]